MKVKITSELNVDSVKGAIYGFSGVGKTRLIATAPNPIIISGEKGLLSLRQADIPYIEVGDQLSDVQDAFDWLSGSAEANNYDSVGYDSISETAERLLEQRKSKHKDPRKAYLEMSDAISALLRNIRDIEGKNVFFVSKMIRRTDEDSGNWWFEPMLPGRVLPFGLPYFVDEVFCMEAHGDEKEQVIKLQTFSDRRRVCKDRSGMLDNYEEPNLSDIINKITG